MEIFLDESMTPSKLKRLLETLHPAYKNKNAILFERKANRVKRCRMDLYGVYQQNARSSSKTIAGHPSYTPDLARATCGSSIISKNTCVKRSSMPTMNLVIVLNNFCHPPTQTFFQWCFFDLTETMEKCVEHEGAYKHVEKLRKQTQKFSVSQLSTCIHWI